MSAMNEDSITGVLGILSYFIDKAGTTGFAGTAKDLLEIKSWVENEFYKYPSQKDMLLTELAAIIEGFNHYPTMNRDQIEQWKANLREFKRHLTPVPYK